MYHDRLQGELEKIAPARKKPAKKTATSAYAFYVQEQFSSHRKAGMDTKDVSHHTISVSSLFLQSTALSSKGLLWCSACACTIMLMRLSSLAERDVNVLKVMKALGAAWKTLSVSEKEGYKGKAGQSS